MRKILYLFVFILLLSLFAACSNQDSSAEADTGGDDNLLEEVKDKGVLHIGTEGTFAPFSFHDDSGKLTGYDVEIVEEVAERLGVEPEFHETQWDSIFAGLDAKRFDVIANQVGITEERLEKYEFTEPYTRSTAVLIIHEDTEGITSFEDMEGKVASGTLTSNWGELAESHGAELEKVEGFNQAIDLVISKRVDGTFHDKLTILDFLNQRPDAPIEIIPEETEAVSENAFMFRQGNEEIIEKFNSILEDMREDGTLAEISEKWFGEDVS
ncbi:amino acid ABC transporter substrate-binding protein [Oceanobacillus neutriphilus]|uniref:amino acid ABC transporter substrate-binding protein n=1 Tax=Oceanobacillus neutriphilus TaxID=531815 RepID=UPI001E613478